MTTEHKPLNATQQLNAIAAQLAELKRDVALLVALATNADPLEDRSHEATRALMARNARRHRGEACPECQDTGMVLDALGAIPCPVCSGPSDTRNAPRPSDVAVGCSSTASGCIQRQDRKGAEGPGRDESAGQGVS